MIGNIGVCLMRLTNLSATWGLWWYKRLRKIHSTSSVFIGIIGICLMDLSDEVDEFIGNIGPMVVQEVEVA